MYRLSFFEMKPKKFIKRKQCPICTIDETLSRESKEYKSYFKVVKNYNFGLCELTGKNNTAVHH